jgi:hypothetical protein
VFAVARSPKPLGLEQHPVFMDDEFDVAADCLVGNRVIGIVGHGIVLRRRGRRGQVVDQRDQALRLVLRRRRG